MKKRYVSLSVHQLVDFLLREGDIDNRIYNQETMNAGSRLHSSYQSRQGEGYLSEMFLSARIEVEEGVIVLQGRADGIFEKNGIPVIDEIKTTIAPVTDFAAQQEAWHLGQAVCYAYMYLCMQGGDKAGVRLTYFHQRNTDDKLIKDYEFTFDELEKRVKSLCSSYLQFRSATFTHVERRDVSAKALSFPYQAMRKGQRELARYVFGLAQSGGQLFVEAPTGIGKTMSTLYPCSKAFKEGRVDRVFYLTAKNTGSQSAFDAMGDLTKAGLNAWDIVLFAKEKVCFCPGIECNPDECPFARNYYGKVRGAVAESLASGKRFTPDYVREYCLEHELCPFEFQLDLALYCDVVIADYNYFFDPIVYLDRFFGEGADASTSLLLIDEAHNLLERGRDMYSFSLSKSLVSKAKKSLKGDKFKSLRKSLSKVLDCFIDMEKQGMGTYDRHVVDEGLVKALTSLKGTFQRANKKNALPTTPEYREFSREANRFLRLADEHFDTTYRCYVSVGYHDVVFRALEVDPSKKMSSCLAKVKGAVLFSATLSPIDYYMDATLGGKDYPYLLLTSPFPREHLDLMVAPKVSVRYKDRAASYPVVAEYLKRFVEGKVGNYFLYFPSYEYLESILPTLDFGEAEVLMQSRQMSVAERNEFLLRFSPSPDHTRVGLLILGGAFSEGIDMVDDRLIGVAVVGVGLPSIGKENDLIRDYHDAREGKGFDYAYKDPGMNKVLQAVGRLIRSESDRGAALLIDDRYAQNDYRDLFQRIYPDYDVVLTPEEVGENLKAFYKK